MLKNIKKKSELKKRLAIFASGRGTNMDNIFKHIDESRINAEVGLVFSDKPKSLALIKAKKKGVYTVCLPPSEYSSKEALERVLIAELESHSIDLIVLAGYMRILSPYIINVYKNKILNIHPSLLPAFKGAHAIEDAYNAGVKVTGVTVHFVSATLDAGPIIAQSALIVHEGERLSELEDRIHALEYRLYPKVINLILKKKVTIKQTRVIIKK